MAKELLLMKLWEAVKLSKDLRRWSKSILLDSLGKTLIMHEATSELSDIGLELEVADATPKDSKSPKKSQPEEVSKMAPKRRRSTKLEMEEYRRKKEEEDEKTGSSVKKWLVRTKGREEGGTPNINAKNENKRIVATLKRKYEKDPKDEIEGRTTKKENNVRKIMKLFQMTPPSPKTKMTSDREMKKKGMEERWRRSLTDENYKKKGGSNLGSLKTSDTNLVSPQMSIGKPHDFKFIVKGATCPEKEEERSERLLDWNQERNGLGTCKKDDEF